MPELHLAARKDEIRPPYPTFLKVCSTKRLGLIPINLFRFIVSEANIGNGGKENWWAVEYHYNKRIKALHTFPLSKVSS